MAPAVHAQSEQGSPPPFAQPAAADSPPGAALTPAEEAYRRGLDLLEDGTPRAAVSSFELALARGYRPPADAYLQLGLAHKRIPLHTFQAIRALRRAIRTDPTTLDALYEFAETYLALDGWEGQREARRALVAILKQDPFYRDAYARWQSLYLYRNENQEVADAFRARLRSEFDTRLAMLAADLYLQIGRLDHLEQLLDDWSRREVQPSSAHYYYRARLLFQHDREPEATESYFRGLDAVSSEADLELFWRDLSPLISASDRELAELRSLGGRVAFISGFWEARDPLPFSGANERLAEQYRRIAEVRKRYLWKKPMAKEKMIGDRLDDLGRPSFDTRLEGRSVDDRGTIYLRHGEPDWKSVELVYVSGDGGGEYWRYDRPDLPGGRLQFHFTRMNGPMGKGNDTVFSLLPTTEMGVANWRPGRVGREDLENMLFELDTDSYLFDYGDKVFPVALSGGTFRNLERPDRTDLLLAVAVPLASIRRFEGEVPTYLVQQMKLYDADYRQELLRVDTLELTGGEGSEGALVGAFQITSHPGERRYAVQLEARRSGALGLQKGEMVFPSYGERKLQISDVLLASRVSPAATDPVAPRREGYAIRPLLNQGLEPQQPLHLYYEIYELTAGTDGKARYRVEYRVSPEAPVTPGLLERIFGGGDAVALGEAGEVGVAFEKEHPGPAERVGETISLDLSELPEGRYRVGVNVRDAATGSEAERVVVLELRAPAEER